MDLRGFSVSCFLRLREVRWSSYLPQERERDLDYICSEKPYMLWKIKCHITKKRDLGMSPDIIFSLISATNFSVESSLVDFLLENVKMCWMLPETDLKSESRACPWKDTTLRLWNWLPLPNLCHHCLPQAALIYFIPNYPLRTLYLLHSSKFRLGTYTPDS